MIKSTICIFMADENLYEIWLDYLNDGFTILKRQNSSSQNQGFNAQFAFVRTDNSTDRRSTERRSPDRRSIDRRSPSPHYHSRSSERRTNRSSNNHVKHESHVINERSDHVKHEPKSYSGFDSNVETWNDTNQIVNILKNGKNFFPALAIKFFF